MVTDLLGDVSRAGCVSYCIIAFSAAKPPRELRPSHPRRRMPCPRIGALLCFGSVRHGNPVLEFLWAWGLLGDCSVPSRLRLLSRLVPTAVVELLCLNRGVITFAPDPEDDTGVSVET